MKKILIAIFAATIAFGAYAGQDKSIKEARIYINPGHGSWTGNDRNMATINHGTGDTTGFYESNTNLWKGLKLRQILIDWGMPASNICMSRVKNGPYPHNDAEAEKYNRGLSEIAQEANSFNTDYFLSIHSDAGYENHTLLIHKGYTTPADDNYMYHGSKYTAKELMQVCSDMCHTLWPILTSNGIDVMNASYMQPGKKPYIYGDFTFYYGWTSPSQNTGKSGYLGVLRTNTCPGLLSEGYSHQYMPATHRALNPDYCGQEGMRYARGMQAWFGWEKDPKGYIMGSVKDLHNRLYHDLYNYAEGSIDQWKPINDAVVTLYKGGVEVAKYQVDNEWNGVFVFEKLEPGNDYTIDVTAPGYKSAFALDEEYNRPNETFTVTANETLYPIIYLEEEGYEGNPCYNYPDPTQDKWLVLSDKYNMRQDFVNKSIAALEGKTIRKEIAHGDSIYVLALDAENNPYIYIVNAKTQELYKELSTAGVGDASDERELLKISDIAFTSDSILVACNYEKMSLDDDDNLTGTFRVYKWAKDEATRTPTGDPEIWFEGLAPNSAGNWYNSLTGQSLAISGRLEDCKVITTAQTTGSSGEIRFSIYTISRKGVIAVTRNQDSAQFKSAVVGDNFSITTSPFNNFAIVLDGANMTATEYLLGEAEDGGKSTPTNMGALSSSVMPVAASGAHFFKYAKHVLMAVPQTDANGKNVGVAIYDVNNGLDKATLIETTNTTLDAAEVSFAMVSTHVEDDDITIYLNKNNTVSRFTTQDVDQTYYNRVYAYDLKVTASENNYTFSFKVNEDCLDGGKLIFYNAGAKVGEIALDNVVAGVNEKVVAATALPGNAGQILNWSVEVASKNVSMLMPLLSKEDYKLNRAYATVDKSPESANFGKVYVSDCAGVNKAGNGVYVYGQDYVKQNETAYTEGVTFNTNQGIAVDAKGNVYVADNAAANSGIYVANPTDFTFAQFCEGTRTSGVISNNGVDVGGVTSSVVSYGSKMYAYVKKANGTYAIYVYDMEGKESTTWDTAPTNIINLALTMTADASIAPVEQGVWVCQTVGSTAVSATKPALFFVTNEGEITFNQGSAQNEHLLVGAAGSGLAASKDGKTLVVNDENGILQFYNVTWNDNTPTLEVKYTYEHGVGVGAKRIQDGASVEQMVFDYAGNLIVGGHYLGVFSIPTENNVCETPARSWMTVTVGNANVAIEEVDADANAPVEFYNLQGVKVARPENGVFIKKQGNKVTKVIM